MCNLTLERNVSQQDLENIQTQQYFEAEYRNMINNFFYVYGSDVINLVAPMSEGQIYYLKFLKIASQRYISNDERWNTILTSLSAKEFEYVKMFIRGKQ